ncbi:hypothetical protein, partial [Streptomyces clavuligerus]
MEGGAGVAPDNRYDGNVGRRWRRGTSVLGTRRDAPAHGTGTAPRSVGAARCARDRSAAPGPASAGARPGGAG